MFISKIRDWLLSVTMIAIYYHIKIVVYKNIHIEVARLLAVQSDWKSDMHKMSNS